MQLKVMAGKYWKTIDIEPASDNRLRLKFNYDPLLIAEIKSMDGARWNPIEKSWYVKNSPRNQFVFEYLAGKKPYARYDAPLIDLKPNRPLYKHQTEMVRFGLTRRQCIFAAEMGTGKTLAAIEVMEHSGFKDWLWIGPRSALRAVELEFDKWDSKIYPQLHTYDGLKKVISNWKDGDPAPHGVVFDESSKVKTPTAQRSLAALHLSDAMRKEYGDDAYVILMSGTPAPKAPTDWWMQAEIARPGFLKEGTYERFKRALGLIVDKESLTGGVYPELVTWWDDSKRCKICGGYPDADQHNAELMYMGNYHQYVSSINEIERLYQRLNGLVTIWFKRDCLDLPEKIYRKIYCKANDETLRAAKLILGITPRVVTANMLLRELSDGFQYKEVEAGEQLCPLCHGTKEIEHAIHQEPEFITVDESNIAEHPDLADEDLPVQINNPRFLESNEQGLIVCPNCEGDGVVPNMQRQAIPVPCPKDDVLRDLLEEHEEVGRIVIFAGYTASVDKCVEICQKIDWQVIRVDGRGWWSTIGQIKDTDMLRAFQDKSRKIPKIAFVGQPEAGGMGLTLTESPTIFYFSNTFKFEARAQSEDRIHRPGMDVNKGATIIDIIHLPTDEKVLENLQKKRRLQDTSLGVYIEALEKGGER